EVVAEADGRGVGEVWVGVQRAGLLKVEEERERLRRDAAAPEPAAEDVSDGAAAVLPPRLQVTGGLAVDYAGLHEGGWIPEHAGLPVLHEDVPLARLELGPADGLPVLAQPEGKARDGPLGRAQPGRGPY